MGPTSPEVIRAEDREKDGATAAVGGPAKKLSPRQRHRHQSLARNKKKQWGAEWMLQLQVPLQVDPAGIEDDVRACLSWILL